MNVNYRISQGLFLRIKRNIALSIKFLASSKAMASKYSSQELLQCAKSFVPTMTFKMHKGQCGRIGVVGGSKEYTGAPYFAGISVLKVGADLSHIFCMESAASVIKSYSPELIVHPVLDHKDGVNEIDEWLPRLHSLVLGPGLGRDPNIYGNFKGVIEKAKERGLPLVIDADGVYFITQDPRLITGYKKATLTPNAIEFKRLYEKVFGKSVNSETMDLHTQELASELNGVTIVCKGEIDIISDGTLTIGCSNVGSARRCGGQGDLLSGSMGTFTYWAYRALQQKEKNEIVNDIGPNMCAAYAACFLTRECNKIAFSKFKRSMTTSDMINCINEVFEHFFEK